MMDEPLLHEEDADTGKQTLRRSVLYTKASFIIVTEFCERLCYYGFAGSLVYFFQSSLSMSNADAINQFQLWSGCVYVTPLIGGMIADVYLGRFRTLLVFSGIYLLGLVLFIYGAVPSAIRPPVIFLAMYTIALAAGGIKPNASTMGADQFDLRFKQDQRESAQFFSFFYVAINLGALVSYTLLAEVAQNGVNGLGGKQYGFLVSVSFQAAILTVGIFIFVSGSAVYVKKQPQSQSMLARAVCMLTQALNRPRPARPLAHFLDAAATRNGGSYPTRSVEALKAMWRLLPFLACFVCYWAVYSQTKTSFQLQSCQSDLRLGDIELPVSSLNIFNNITILVCVPMFDRFLFPWLKRQGLALSMQQKILIGFCIALVAMLVSGVVEVFRLRAVPAAGDYNDVAARDNISPCRNIDNYTPQLYLDYLADGASFQPANCRLAPASEPGCDVPPSELPLSCVECDDIPQMSRLSVLAQIPQFVLIGVSEIFASITSLEFFYSQAPANMRSVSQALNLLTSAIGSWVTIPLTLVVCLGPKPWITTDINSGHLDSYFFLLSGIQGLVILVYVKITRTFVPADQAWLAELDMPEEEEEGGEEGETVQ